MSEPPRDDNDRGGTPVGGYPELPILAPDELPRRSTQERYGSFFYVAIAGLVLLVGMIGWFGWSVWAMRDLWRDVYLLHDPRQADSERIAAAKRIAVNPDATERQRYDITLRTDVPDTARFVIGLALTSEAMSGDPRGYALAVARSEGWPDWLRWLHLRPLAYGAGEGRRIHRDALRALTEHSDPILRLWAWYTLAEADPDDNEARSMLEAEAATRGEPWSELAALLLQALDAEDDATRVARLDEATRWTAARHAQAEGFALEPARAASSST